LLGVVVLMGGCRRAAPPAPLPSPSPPAQPAAKLEAPREEAPPVVTEEVGEALAEFNKGAGYLEKREYTNAAKAFERVLELAPDWTAARFNFGLAQYNLEREENLEVARKAFEEVLESDPDHLHARFALGLYFQHLGKNEEALKCFEAVYERDSEQPHVGYKYAEALIGVGRTEEAMKILEQVVENDPGFNSAVYKLASQYMRNRQREKALPLFDRLKALKANDLAEGAFTAGEAYGYAGKYYLALGADSLPLPPPEATPGPRIEFSPETRPLAANASVWKWEGGSVGLPGIAAGDVDGDGDLDLCLTGLDDRGGASLWLNDGSGRFSAGPTLADKAVSPCFGDVDNDGDVDLWLGRAGSDLYLENDGKGQFAPGSPPAPDDADAFTPCARLFDIDSDGDLDPCAFRLAAGSLPAAGDAAAAPSSIYSNNRDGSFEDVAPRLGLALGDTPVAAVVYDDFDNDRDLDLVIFPAGDAEPIAWVNHRVWEYEKPDASATGLATRGVVGATSGDPDKDGDRDLLVFTGERVELYVNQGRFRFELDQGFSDRCGRLGGTGGGLADVDNDGDLDLVIADAHRPDGSRGPALLVNDWPQDRFLNAADLDPGCLLAAIDTGGDASCLVADFTGDGRCDVMLASAGRQPMLIENTTQGGHWIAIDLVGKREKDKRARSNNSAIGARVEVKTGRVAQQFVVGVPSGPVAMPPFRVHAGLGSNANVEWLRVIWPDGVLQGEVEVAGDQVMTLAEVQRKTTSCPHLFAWNGTCFELVSDFGGVGGLGYFLAPGTYATPDPTEYLPIPRLAPLDGEYVLQVTEPLEEIVYLDEAKLIAVDHPAGTDVYPHEMMAVGVAPPPFELFCFRTSIDPVRAVDHRGVDVTEPLLRIDRRYAGATEPDLRFAGFAEDHFVELDFGDRLAEVRRDARLILCLHGWVKYGYSSANYAAGQAGLRLEAPSVDVFRDGRWVELMREVGYPAGLNHTMTLDVSGKILPSDGKIRLRSNMELHWDRIFLAAHDDDAPLAVQEMPARTADLHFFGYPHEYSPDGREPNLYDYRNADPWSSWKLMPGNYTRYGDVAELLLEPDDCYVIMGHGEEVTLRFPVEAFGPVPGGCRRSFLLKTDSFCKDMDLYTARSDAVEPLPFHAMTRYPYGPDEHYPDDAKTREYRRRYNTRKVLPH
jgi:thioredoxin-like negative regulator of GroEL